MSDYKRFCVCIVALLLLDMNESSNCHDNSCSCSHCDIVFCSAGKELRDVHGTGCLQHGKATDLCPFRSLY